MTLAISSIACDFEAETTNGKIRFHDYIAGPAQLLKR